MKQKMTNEEGCFDDKEAKEESVETQKGWHGDT